MAQKLIIDFLRDWVRDQQLREEVLHKEKTGMQNYGLDLPQIALLRKFDQQKIAEKIAKELGLDLADLQEAIYGVAGPSAAAGAAAYDEGRTHIRRVNPKVISANTATEVVLMGHGFKSDITKVTVEFRTGVPPVSVQGQVTEVKCGVDVWQRVAVDVTLGTTGDWEVRAHNDDDKDASNNWIWSEPTGTVHVV
jgi:hypothetical protein